MPQYYPAAGPPSSPRPSGRLLEATAQDLAFRRQGLLTIARRRILIRDPAGLHALA